MGVGLDLVVQVQDVQNVQHLPLVLVQTLDLHVEQRVGVHIDAVGMGDILGQAQLVVPLDYGQPVQHSLVVLVGQQLFQGVGVFQEVVADQLMQALGQPGVGLAQPPPVGDAVGDVQEPVGGILVVVAEDGLLQDVGVQLAHAVDLVAGGQAQVGHADLAVGNHGHPVQLALVVAVEGAQLFQKPAVDLRGDGVDPGHLLLVELHAPALQGLAHHGVVGVGQGAAGDIPGIVPVKVVLIQQQAHQLGHAQGRMGVVDVDGDLFGQVFQGAVGLEMLSQNGLQRGGAQQILLLQPQPLALDMVVGGVKDLGDGLGHGVLLQGADVVAPGEGRHVKALGQLGGPEHQLVHGLGVVAGDVEVVGHCHHGGIAVLGNLELAVVVPLVDLTAKADLHGVVLLGHQPHVAQLQPVVGQLHLPAVHDLLLKDAELVTDGEAGGGVAQPGERVHVAGGQPAQTAVAQTRVGVHLIQVGNLDAQVLHGLGKGLLQPQVVQVVAQAGAHQELHGHIVDLLAALFAVAALVLPAAVVHLVAHHGAEGLVGLLVGGFGHGAAKEPHTGFFQAFFRFVLVHSSS